MISKHNIISLFRFQMGLPNELCLSLYRMKLDLEEDDHRNFHRLRYSFYIWIMKFKYWRRKRGVTFWSIIDDRMVPLNYDTQERENVPGFWLNYSPISNNDMNYYHPESEYHFNYNPEDNIKIYKEIKKLSPLNVIKDIKHYKSLIEYYYQNEYVPGDDCDEYLDAINCVRMCEKENCQSCQRIGHYGISFLRNLDLA